MQTSDNNRAAKVNRRKVQTSTTLNRKYTKRPTKKSQEKTAKVKKSPKVTHFHDTMMQEQQGVQSGEMTQEMQGVQEMEQSEMQQGEQQMQEMQAEKMRGAQEMQEMQAEGMEQGAQQMKEMQIAGMEQGGQEAQEMQQSEAQQSELMDALETQETEEKVEPHPIQDKVNTKMRKRTAQMQELKQEKQQDKPTAKELKDQAIQKALSSASSMGETVENMNTSKVKTKSKKSSQMHFGFWRVMLALSCAATAVFAIAYFVNLNMPDISLRVAAMQTGMDPAYPNYVPRDYSVSSITSEDGKIAMEFNNSSAGTSFSLIEEKSSWDTNALVSNFVKEEYGENYSIVREQGLTIYISGSNAAWVNGGLVYKIKAAPGTLTNKQIRSIATSL